MLIDSPTAEKQAYCGHTAVLVFSNVSARSTAGLRASGTPGRKVDLSETLQCYGKKMQLREKMCRQSPFSPQDFDFSAAHLHSTSFHKLRHHQSRQINRSKAMTIPSPPLSRLTSFVIGPKKYPIPWLWLLTGLLLTTRVAVVDAQLAQSLCSSQNTGADSQVCGCRLIPHAAVAADPIASD